MKATEVLVLGIVLTCTACDGGGVPPPNDDTKLKLVVEETLCRWIGADYQLHRNGRERSSANNGDGDLRIVNRRSQSLHQDSR